MTDQTELKRLKTEMDAAWEVERAAQKAAWTAVYAAALAAKYAAWEAVAYAAREAEAAWVAARKAEGEK